MDAKRQVLILKIILKLGSSSSGTKKKKEDSFKYYNKNNNIFYFLLFNINIKKQINITYFINIFSIENSKL